MKDVYTKLNEAIDSLRKAGKLDKYREIVPITAGTPVEVQLNCAEAILKGDVKEAQRTITKHNGAADNGRVTELRESAGNGGELENAKEKMSHYRESVVKIGKRLGFSEVQLRQLENVPLDGTKLNERQLREYRFAKQIGLTEAEALQYVRTPIREIRQF
jgi:hypothetical protein